MPKCPVCNNAFDPRTLGRNNHWWLNMAILGNELGYSKEQMSVIVKTKFFWYEDFPDRETGEVLRVYESTTEWTNRQFDENFREVKIWAGEKFNIILLERSEYMESLQEENN